MFGLPKEENIEQRWGGVMITNLAASDNICLLSHTFWRSGVHLWPMWAHHSGLKRLTSGVAPVHSFLEIVWKNLFPNLFKFLAEFSSLWIYTWVPVSLLAEGHSQVLEVTSTPFHKAPSVVRPSNGAFPPAISCQLPLMIESLGPGRATLLSGITWLGQSC